MRELPLNISGKKARELLEALGIDTEWLQEIHYTRRVLTVVHARTNQRGQVTAAGAQLSTVTTTINVEGPVGSGSLGAPR